MREGSSRRSSGKEPFSAEIYLRNATGPFAPYFRGMMPDVDGLAMLDPDRLKAQMDGRRRADRRPLWLHAGPAQPGPEDPRRESSMGRLLVRRPRERREASRSMSTTWSRCERTEQIRRRSRIEKERASDARRGVEADRRSLIQPLSTARKRCARRSPSVANARSAERLGRALVESATGPAST